MDRKYVEIRGKLNDVDEYILGLQNRISELECELAEQHALRIKDREIIKQAELLIDAQQIIIESYQLLNDSDEE